jgi:hypothetical protein
MQKFLDKYKVIITAIIASLAITFQQFAGEPEVSWKALGLAGLVAIFGAVGNQLRGQYPSIVALLGIAVYTITDIANGGVISWQQIAISVVVALGGLVAPPPKAREYEHDPAIERAKDK